MLAIVKSEGQRVHKRNKVPIPAYVKHGVSSSFFWTRSTSRSHQGSLMATNSGVGCELRGIASSIQDQIPWSVLNSGGTLCFYFRVSNVQYELDT